MLKPKTFRELVTAELNDTASPEERMLLYDSLESLHNWLLVLEEIKSSSLEELERQKAEKISKIDKIVRNINTVQKRKLVILDPKFIDRENGKIDEIQSSIRFLEREMEKYWNKIEARKLHIQEKIIFLLEENQQVIDDFLVQEEKILLLNIEHQAKVRDALLINWKDSMAKGMLLGASYLNRMLGEGISVEESYRTIIKFIDGPLREWRNNPKMELANFDDWRNENKSLECNEDSPY